MLDSIFEPGVTLPRLWPGSFSYPYIGTKICGGESHNNNRMPWIGVRYFYQGATFDMVALFCGGAYGQNKGYRKEA